MTHHTSFSEKEQEILRAIAIIFSSLSLVSTLIVFFCYWYFKEIRQIAYELVVYLCLAIFFYSLSSFIPYNDNPYFNVHWCALQSYMITSFQISSITWCGIIGYTAYIGVYDPNKMEENEKFYRIIFLLIGFLFPLLIGLVIIFTESYGPSGCWCWLRITNESTDTSFILFIFFYAFSWIMIFVNAFFFIKVILRLKTDLNSSSDQKIVNKLTSKLKWYPIVLIICLIPGTINRIYDFSSEKSSFALSLVQTIFDYSAGIIYAIVYGLNSTVKDAIKNCFCFVFCCNRIKRSSRVSPSRMSQDLNLSKERCESFNSITSEKNRTFIE